MMETYADGLTEAARILSRRSVKALKEDKIQIATELLSISNLLLDLATEDLSANLGALRERNNRSIKPSGDAP